LYEAGEVIGFNNMKHLRTVILGLLAVLFVPASLSSCDAGVPESGTGFCGARPDAKPECRDGCSYMCGQQCSDICSAAGCWYCQQDGGWQMVAVDCVSSCYVGVPDSGTGDNGTGSCGARPDEKPECRDGCAPPTASDVCDQQCRDICLPAGCWYCQQDGGWQMVAVSCPQCVIDRYCQNGYDCPSGICGAFGVCL
jgi:hypothetical protein